MSKKFPPHLAKKYTAKVNTKLYKTIKGEALSNALGELEKGSSVTAIQFHSVSPGKDENGRFSKDVPEIVKPTQFAKITEGENKDAWIDLADFNAPSKSKPNIAVIVVVVLLIAVTVYFLRKIFL